MVKWKYSWALLGDKMSGLRDNMIPFITADEIKDMLDHAQWNQKVITYQPRWNQLLTLPSSMK